MAFEKRYEYVVEAPTGVEYCFGFDEVEDTSLESGVLVVDCFDNHDTQAFAPGAWARFYIREAS